jgi:lactoylglutathione lyase
MAAYSLGHVGINVTDIDRSKTFYQSIFDFEVLTERTEGDRLFTFLGLDGDIVLTLWQQSSGEYAPDRPGLHHLGLMVDDIDAVRAAETKARALGAEILHGGVVPHREGSSSGGIFFTDPDGTRIEVYSASGVDTAEAPFGDTPTCGFF